MDLEKLKNKWQSAEIKSSMSEDTIQQMLNNKGKSAYSYLKKYEKIGMATSIILIINSTALYYFTYEYLKLKDDIFPAFFAISCVLIFFWQGYKYYFLSKVDLLKMNILEISEHINRYKKHLSQEWIVAIVWSIVTTSIFIMERMNHLSTRELVIMGAAILAFILVPTYIIYKLTIAKNITKLELAIKEVKEIKKDNIE